MEELKVQMLYGGYSERSKKTEINITFIFYIKINTARIKPVISVFFTR